MGGLGGLEPGVREQVTVWDPKLKTKAPGLKVSATSGRWLYNRRRE